MKTKEVKWYEFWYGYASVPPYPLIVWCDQNNKIEIYDPIEKEIAYSTNNYDDAVNWLAEDEFSLAEGRMEDSAVNVPD